jgi:hypothetical protein
MVTCPDHQLIHTENARLGTYNYLSLYPPASLPSIRRPSTPTSSELCRSYPYALFANHRAAPNELIIGQLRGATGHWEESVGGCGLDARASD